MSLYEKLVNHEEKLSLVGLGYVGMPIAVAFAKKIDVIGFDVNASKIELYRKGIDPTKEVGDETIRNSSVNFTADETELRKARFHIVAVPTPVNDDHTPDLSPVEGASRILGRNLSKDSVVVFESTVYPGVTEEVCVPILEKESGLKCGIDFKIGYSPERINPGDKLHRLENIKKVVSGMDEETLDVVANVYELVVEAGVHRAESIKVAEAAKNKVHIAKSKSGIVVKGIDDVAVRFSRCCNPVPGDEIVGFVTRGRGLSIHRTDCVNMIHLTEGERARLIDAEWEESVAEKNGGQYLAEIKMYVYDRQGLLMEVSRILTENGVDVKSMNVRTSKQGTATIETGFIVHGRSELEKVVMKLRQLEGVIDIERATG